MTALSPDYPVWPMLFAAGSRHRVSPLLHLGAGVGRVARHAPAGIQYLATPFTKLVRGPGGTYCATAAFDASARAGLHARRLALAGVTAISPIVQAVEICATRPGIGAGAGLPDPLDEAFWADWCRPLLWASRSVIVPAIPGWSKSVGVWREVVWALDRNMPVFVYAGGLEGDDGQ
ncbi:DUF1937 family protein [Roseicitreum antarcticum]|uniref:DUF1937 domain-containing protein n=1 Tax=Roseicitreum antarcticum TaxID=564137 RepID=A0A1H2WAY3_9RHOB|nr:DUF1937 family protein [Roseicitreum antarcticum]SDW77685.1 protein of unknown function [Roseicitreum antarcticum]